MYLRLLHDTNQNTLSEDDLENLLKSTLMILTKRTIWLGAEKMEDTSPTTSHP